MGEAAGTDGRALHSLGALGALARLALDRSPTAQFIADHRGRVVHANRAYCELVGASLEEVIGTQPNDVLLPEDVSLLEEHTRAAFADRAAGDDEVAFTLELRLRRSDGSVRACEASVNAALDEQGKTWFLVYLVDITPLRDAREQTSRLARIAETTSDCVAIADVRGQLLWVNRAARSLFGIPDDLPTDLHALSFYTQGSAERMTELVLPLLQEGRSWEGELDMRRPDGAVMHVWQALNPEMDAAGRLRRVSAIARDITAQKQLEAELSHQATHDPLTQLPNRALLLDHLDRALTLAHHHDRATALLFIDLDRFKAVNDRLGHEAGDDLLRSAAQRIAHVVRPHDIVARLGGDEFVVLCSEITDEHHATTIAERILHRLEAEPVTVSGTQVRVSASIGVTVALGRDGPHPEGLLREADAAMYLAKDRGRGRIELFDETMRSKASHRQALAEELRGALSSTGLLIVHQPIIDLRSGLVAGSEALVRWLHPDRGLLGPNEFIGVAEETGLATELGAFVLHLACEQLASWIDDLGPHAPTLHINLSPRQLVAPTLAQVVQRALDRSGADPTRLCVEVTERAMLDDLEPAVAALRGLRALGVHVAVDDFGTGHSSLAELRRFPIDLLKIDRTFVDGLGPDREDTAIASAAVRLAHSMDLQVVAEGVETADQLAVLNDLGCDRAQGYLFARPGSADEVSELVRLGPVASHLV